MQRLAKIKEAEQSKLQAQIWNYLGDAGQS